MKNIKEKFGSKLKKRNGFTLIEMLIVVAIIAILVMVSIPLVTTSVDKAKEATDDANLRSAKAAAVIEYLGNNKKTLETTPMYYDVEKGTLVATAPTEGYNQSDLSDVLGEENKADAESKVIKVSVVSSPTAGEPNIKCEWVTKGA